MGAASYVLYPLPRFANRRELDLGLGSLPNISITSAYVDETEEFAASTLVDSDDYVVRNGRLRLMPDASSAWSDVEGANKVSLTAGWSFEADVVGDPLMALIAQAAQAVIDRPHLQQVGSQNVSGLSFTGADLDDLLPSGVRSALGPYVVWSTRVA